MEISVIKQTPLFKGISEDVILPFILSKDHSLRRYKSGEFIAMQGDICRSLLLLCEGNARSQMVNSEGKQLTVGNLSAPLLLAPAFVFCSENRFPANIEAMDNCEILAIDKEAFLRYLGEQPKVMNNFLELVSNRVLMLSKKLKEFALQSLKSRLLNYLQLHHAMSSQNEMANILGVARPSLARAVSELTAEGCISILGKEVSVNEERSRRYLM